jgi:hypothetical protein
MVKVIVAKEKFNSEHLLGTYLDESHYDILVEEDTDCYMPAISDLTSANDSEKFDERQIAFKFRKNYFTQTEQDQAYIGLREAATESQNRGLAAGPRGEILSTTGRKGRDWVNDYELAILDHFLDDGSKLIYDVNVDTLREQFKNNKMDVDENRGKVWLRSEVTKVYPEYHGWFDNWVDSIKNESREVQKAEATKVAENWISVTNYAKSVYSGVAGWYDRYPRIPYGRATSYTEKNPDKFAMAYPFLQSLNRGFKDLMPWRWGNQKAAADKLDKRFLVPETVFTTITVNKSFRTAAHRDAGDLNAGLSNLLVVGSGEYTGGYLIFPEYRVAVNVRPGDLLLVNNHEIIHGNTEIKLNHDKAERISLVCYFREKMLELKSWPYESLRRQFVEERKSNKDHPMWRPLWNGVSPGMWETQEWRDYLTKHNMKDEDGVVGVAGSLEDFF